MTPVDEQIPNEEGTPVSLCCSQKSTDHPIELLQGIDVYYDKPKLPSKCFLLLAGKFNVEEIEI